MAPFGNMATALDNLRKKYGLYYNPSEREIFEEAKELQRKRNLRHLAIFAIIILEIGMLVGYF